MAGIQMSPVWVIRRDDCALFERLLGDVLPAFAQAPGCRSVRIYRDVVDTTCFMLQLEFATTGDLERFRDLPAYRRLEAVAEALADGPGIVRIATLDSEAAFL